MISKVNASKYCCEDISLIENYEEAVSSKELYHCHHRLEIQGDKCYFAKELKQLNLYYGRPASELIFLNAKEHKDLHFDYSEKCYKAVLKKYKKNGIRFSDFSNFMFNFVYGDDWKEQAINAYKKSYINMIKDIETGGINNIKESDIDLLSYRLGIINKDEWKDLDFYKYSPYGRIPKKIINSLMDKLKLVIDDNLGELIEEKEQLIKELRTH